MDYYNEKYLPSIVKTGKLTCLIGGILCFVPAIAVTWGFGILPSKEAIASVLLAQLSINVPYWIIEPISFFPVLGVAGTYVAFLSGNISNMRIPCAVAAMNATGTKVGTKEASVISSIGVSISAFVNIIVLTAGVIGGVKLLSVLPEGVKENLEYLLPALIGGSFSMIAADALQSSLCAMILGCGSLMAYNAGLLNWFPVDAFIPCLIVPIFGALLFSFCTYKPDEEEHETT